jgi:hypothetical protein
MNFNEQPLSPPAILGHRQSNHSNFRRKARLKLMSKEEWQAVKGNNILQPLTTSRSQEHSRMSSHQKHRQRAQRLE